MTLVIKQHTENGYHVVLEWVKDNSYKVEVCPCYSNGMCGYSIRDVTYPMSEKKKAESTYYRYVRKYCKGL